jgi:gentisate 1,2-dioxygenase
LLAGAVPKFKSSDPSSARGRFFQRHVLVDGPIWSRLRQNESGIAGVLFGGLQLVIPHEIARVHRHSQSALRYVLDGEGAYTAVQGDALVRYGLGQMPIEFKASGMTSPLFNDPYERTRDALYRLSRPGETDPHHGYKLRYVNRVDGGWAMPTIATWMRWLAKHFQSQTWQCTDGLGFVCKEEGRGETQITGADSKEVILKWKANDIFVVPGWVKHTHHATDDTILFGFSGRSAQEKLGLWRERKQ